MKILSKPFVCVERSFWLSVFDGFLIKVSRLKIVLLKLSIFVIRFWYERLILIITLKPFRYNRYRQCKICKSTAFNNSCTLLDVEIDLYRNLKKNYSITLTFNMLLQEKFQLMTKFHYVNSVSLQLLSILQLKIFQYGIETFQWNYVQSIELKH